MSVQLRLMRQNPVCSFGGLWNRCAGAASGRCLAWNALQSLWWVGARCGRVLLRGGERLVQWERFWGKNFAWKLQKIILAVVLRAGLLPVERCFCSATGLGGNLLGFGAITFRSKQVFQINPVFEQDKSCS